MASIGNGTGNGRNGSLQSRYVALALAVVTVAGPGATWWFSKDARQELERVRIDREAAMSALELRLRAEIIAQRAQLDREMVWRDRQQQDHEERLRRLEQSIYGRNQGPQGP